MATYQEILEELCQQASSSSPESLRKILEKHESNGVVVNDNHNDNDNGEDRKITTNADEVPTLPFRQDRLTDLLVRQLFSVPPNSNNDDDDDDETAITNSDCLVVAKALVGCLPSVYLSAIARSVSDLVIAATSSNNNNNNNNKASMMIPLRELDTNTPGLLRLWVSLITHAPVDVHELLTDALISLLLRNNNNNNNNNNDDDDDTNGASEEEKKSVLLYFVEDWTAHLQNSSSSTESKVAAVRCASALIKWVCLLPEGGLALAQNAGATQLFVQMLGDFDDPLQQLGLLDALTEQLEGSIENENDSNNSNNSCNSSNNGNKVPPSTSEWLFSTDLVSLMARFLEDPLLSSAALRYHGALCSTNTNTINNADGSTLDMILDHVKSVVVENGNSVPTRDTDRLPLVRAIAGVAPTSESALSRILGDPVLRGAWFDTKGISGPKLKAAILVSVAGVLPTISKKYGLFRALDLYRLLGDDHHQTTTTTQWLLTMANSPIPEVAIASMALLEASLGLPGAAMATVGIADKDAHRSLLTLLLKPTRELPTAHVRQARYELLSTVMSAIKACPVLEEDPKILRQLLEKLALGPHGQKALRYGSDEPATI